MQKTPIMARILAILLFISIIFSIAVALVMLPQEVAASASVFDNEPESIKAESIKAKIKIEESTLIDRPLKFSKICYKAFYDLDDAKNLLTKVNIKINLLKDALKTDDYTVRASNIMTKELNRLNKIKIKLKKDINYYTRWEQEHYYATKVWEYFKKQGYSNVAVSAILGNMMIETSGGTLDLKPTTYDYTGQYYGLCQWSIVDRPNVANLSFESQLDYLKNTLITEFNTYGNCYSYGFTYEDFIKMTDPAEAAKAFAQVYERCASFSYGLREDAAVKAYNYFNI